MHTWSGEIPWQHLQQLEEFLRQEELEAAETQLSELLLVYPGNVRLAELRAFLYEKQGDRKKALTIWKSLKRETEAGTEDWRRIQQRINQLTASNWSQKNVEPLPSKKDPRMMPQPGVYLEPVTVHRPQESFAAKPFSERPKEDPLLYFIFPERIQVLEKQPGKGFSERLQIQFMLLPGLHEYQPPPVEELRFRLTFMDRKGGYVHVSKIPQAEVWFEVNEALEVQKLSQPIQVDYAVPEHLDRNDIHYMGFVVEVIYKGEVISAWGSDLGVPVMLQIERKRMKAGDTSLSEHNASGVIAEERDDFFGSSSQPDF